MRPASIVMFERLFVASIVLSVASFAIGFGDFSGQVANDPAMQQLGLGSGVVIGLAAAGYALYLLLWYLIAHKAASWAKWVLILLLVISLASLPGALAGPWGLAMFLALAIYVLQVAAVIYLFRGDAKAWFDNKGATDPAALD